VGAPLAAQAVPAGATGQGQYSLRKILSIWAAAAIPMAVLSWILPLLVGGINLGVGDANNLALTRACFLTLGLIWQFVLVLFIVYQDEGSLSLSTIRRRCWLNTPRDPKTGLGRARLFLWLVPVFFVAAFIQMSPLQELWQTLFPFLGEPSKYSFESIMQSDERKAAIEGAWQVLGIFVVLGVFNTILGEELLFRGILLPKMQGVFGKADWLANGVLFGLYHLHQPWSIFGSIAGGTLCYALPSRRFRSAWMGTIIHSVETVFFIFIALGLVLGLA
jgi:membrane protease YdiL (CAAX protease family)